MLRLVLTLTSLEESVTLHLSLIMPSPFGP